MVGPFHYRSGALEMSGIIEAKPIAGMTPYLFDYLRPDGITDSIYLYGTDPDQILEDNCSELPELTYVGELIGTTVEDWLD